MKLTIYYRNGDGIIVSMTIEAGYELVEIVNISEIPGTTIYESNE